MLDLQSLAEAHTPWGVTGESFLVDHVHPSISGHQIIAQTLAAQIALDFLPRPRQWPSTQEIESLFADHYQKLPPSYLAEGLQRLENLRAWTQGKAEGPVLESGLNHRNGL
jgi:phospholipase/lecithinase/hemolysin